MPQIGLIAVIVAVVGNIFLGLFTFLKNPKSSTNKLFFLFTFALAAYLFTNFLLELQTNDVATFFWVRHVMAIALLINLLFFLLANTFPDVKVHLNRKIFWAAIVTTLLLLPTSYFNLIFSSAKAHGGGGDPGLAMPIFLLHTVFSLGGGLFVLVKKFRQAKGIEKAQIRLLLFGAVFMFLMIMLTNLVMVIVFKNSSLVGLLPAYTLIFVGCISYAIIRHRFLDIGLVVARTVSYSLLVGLFALLYGLFFGLLSSLFITSKIESRTLLSSTGLALLMAFSFQPIKRYLEKITDRVFYKSKYDQGTLLYDLTLVMASTLRLEELSHQLLQKMLKIMRVSRGAFLLLDEEKVTEIFYEGYDKFPETDEQKMAAFWQQTAETIVFDDLPEGNIKETMREMNWTLVAQLRTEGKLIGLLSLGEKLSGDIFSADDIKVLEIIAPEAAVAIQNAKAYEEIKRFSSTLQEEIQKATEELTLANDRLHELDKLKSEFVSVASHELRTPMTAIKSYLWMALAGKGGVITDKQKYYLDRAYISTDRLIKLVNDLLNVSRIESGKLSLEAKSLNMGQFVDEVISEVKPRADECGVSISNEYDDAHPLPLALGDSDKLKEVVINLVGNSLKFTSQGGKIRIWFEVKENMIWTHVTDDGEGISPDDLPKLFQKFGLVKESYVTNQKASQGTGLGLYISKSIVELHRGKMWAESEGHGKGATFTFTLPIYSDALFAEFNAEYQKKEGLGIIHSTID